MGDDRGQAAIEFALTLPLALIVVLGLIQIAVVARDRLAIELAAREGARAAAVSAEPAVAAERAVSRVTEGIDVEVTTREAGDAVTVTVHTTNGTDVAVIGPLLPDVALTASATMAWEPP